MKLRIQGNSIRFRLNRREVEEFASTGFIESVVEFGPASALSYALARTPASSSVQAAYVGNQVRVLVPSEVASEWTATDQVSIHGEHRLESGARLQIDVEKDFQCMHKGEEAKDPDAYPNPLASAP